MGLKTKVIINEVNNLSDARYCAGMGVDYLGFVLEEKKAGYLSVEKFKEITSWVSGPEFLGEFHESSAEEVADIASNYSIKTLQLSDIKLVNELNSTPFSIILEISNDNLTEGFLESLEEKVEYFIWRGNAENSEMLNLAIKLASKYPIVLGGNFSPEFLKNPVLSSFQGIALKGGNEIKPGFREFDEMADILELLEEDY